MNPLSMNSTLRKHTLSYLGVTEQAPGLHYLNLLITAYTRTVPWESISRILKRQSTTSLVDCPRWPQEFWEEAFQFGTGGTCYESSLAFFSLLVSIGYQGYLTVNDMDSSRGCHAAIVVYLNGQKYLVDVTIPVHAAVRINPNRITRRQTLFHNYTIRPESASTYQIERSHHTRPNAFTLIDRPVHLPEYQEIVRQDYHETGHFLKEVVIVKVIGRAVWRYNSADNPLELAYFNRNGKVRLQLSPGTAMQAIAGRFRIPSDRLERALSFVGHYPRQQPPASPYPAQPFSGAMAS